MKNNFARVMFTHHLEMLSYITDSLLETKQMYVNGKVSMHRSMEKLITKRWKRWKKNGKILSHFQCSMLIPIQLFELNGSCACVSFVWKNTCHEYKLRSGKWTFHWENQFLFDRWWHLKFEFSSLLFHSKKIKWKNVNFNKITIEMTLYQLVTRKISKKQ